METTIRIKPNELSGELLKKIKGFFKNEKEIELSIRTVDDFGLNKEETKKEYSKRLHKAIMNIERKQNVVSFTEEEFEEFSQSLLGQ